MHISIIDDELILGTKIKKKLEHVGYSVSVFTSYEHYMSHGDTRSHLYIIDISLGDGSGLDIIKWLRSNGRSQAPIIIMSGYSDSASIIYGLDIGADDYMTKPCVPDELIARIRAMLRRPVDRQADIHLQYRGIRLNVENKTVYVGNTHIPLSAKETAILELLMSNMTETITREQLITDTWWWDHIGLISDNKINVTLCRLRKKIGSDFALKTVYKQGFILE